MKFHLGVLLSLLRSKPSLFLPLLSALLKAPSLITDAVAASKSGAWLPFLETHLASLLPIVDAVVEAMIADPALATEILGLFGV